MKLPKVKLLKGSSQDVIHSNIQSLKGVGHSHPKAVRIALSYSTSGLKPKTKRTSRKAVSVGRTKSVTVSHKGLYE